MGLLAHFAGHILKIDTVHGIIKSVGPESPDNGSVEMIECLHKGQEQGKKSVDKATQVVLPCVCSTKMVRA